jgi:ubiquinone/menaquinone biosynthesis C-methylase UbiE
LNAETAALVIWPRLNKPTSLLFDAGARVYGWLTAQSAWREDCRNLVAGLDPAPKTIVDLGCGPGVSTFEIARVRPRDRIIGLDFAGGMLDEARRRERTSGLPSGRIAWVRADAGRLPMTDGSVDVLTGHSFLYLMPDRPRALSECIRVLAPGGRLALMEPNGDASLFQAFGAGSDPKYLASVLLWRPVSRLYGRFTARSLEETLCAAGFARAQVGETLGGLGLLAQAIRPGA